ncbi:uncharacterized protein G2W53_029545 [Senna tora]|uniref:Uncharacterized protein n=1 Tax=Senna tora TaxID=362788 RepID=A0A834T5Q8_9FABA|nr:uncharacterized protein G2W53_029545 [Senna tora]
MCFLNLFLLGFESQSRPPLHESQPGFPLTLELFSFLFCFAVQISFVTSTAQVATGSLRNPRVSSSRYSGGWNSIFEYEKHYVASRLSLSKGFTTKRLITAADSRYLVFEIPMMAKGAMALTSTKRETKSKEQKVICVNCMASFERNKMPPQVLVSDDGEEFK